MDWLSLIVSLVSGGVGGNIAGALMQKFNLGPVGNTIRKILHPSFSYRGIFWGAKCLDK